MAGHAVSPPAPSWGTVRDTFESVNPATGEVLATFGVDGEREVAVAVQQARVAAAWWAGLDWAGRRVRLLAWKSHITRFMGRLAQQVHDETGNTILHLDWAAKHAQSVLKPRRVPSGLLMLNQSATLEYRPLGVIGVIR